MQLASEAGSANPRFGHQAMLRWYELRVHLCSTRKPIVTRKVEEAFMLRQLAMNLSRTATISALMLAGWLGPAVAEVKCQTSQGKCLDSRTHETRNCTTKVCTDSNGTIVSTETIIEVKGDSGGSKPKLPVRNAPTAGAVKRQ